MASGRASSRCPLSNWRVCVSASLRRIARTHRAGVEDRKARPREPLNPGPVSAQALRAFCFAVTPLGGAAHRKVQLFNNSDAEDRAAVKQRREEGCRSPARCAGGPEKVGARSCRMQCAFGAACPTSCGLGREDDGNCLPSRRRIAHAGSNPVARSNSSDFCPSGGVVEPTWP